MLLRHLNLLTRPGLLQPYMLFTIRNATMIFRNASRYQECYSQSAMLFIDKNATHNQ